MFYYIGIYTNVSKYGASTANGSHLIVCICHGYMKSNSDVTFNIIFIYHLIHSYPKFLVIFF